MPIELSLPILLHSRVPLAGETSVRCRVRFRWKKEKREVDGVMAAAAVLASCCCYYSATFPSLLYPVPMEDDSCKRVEASDKAEITVLESCIGLYTGLFHFILFYSEAGREKTSWRQEEVCSKRCSGEVVVRFSLRLKMHKVYDILTKIYGSLSGLFINPFERINMISNFLFLYLGTSLFTLTSKFTV